MANVPIVFVSFHIIMTRFSYVSSNPSCSCEHTRKHTKFGKQVRTAKKKIEQNERNEISTVKTKSADQGVSLHCWGVKVLKASNQNISNILSCLGCSDVSRGLKKKKKGC